MKLFQKNRLVREKHTIGRMIRIYCRKNHGSVNVLCKECRDLLNYAYDRIDKCTFNDLKPTCAKCHIHCYKPEMREKIQSVMRFSGPRMIIYHPVLTIMHFIDKLNK